MAFIGACITGVFLSKAASSTFIDGQTIEVREGDTWSPASVVKHEGRKYLIHYTGVDATTDEWVTIDWMRIPGSHATPAAIPVTPAPTPTSVTPAPVASAPHLHHSDDMPDEVIPEIEPNRAAIDVDQPNELCLSARQNKLHC